MSNDPYRWRNVPGVTYPEPRRREKKPTPSPLFLKDPDKYTFAGELRKHPFLPESEKANWCTMKQAMELLNCSHRTVTRIAKAYNIESRVYSANTGKGFLTNHYLFFNLAKIKEAAHLRKAKRHAHPDVR
jgi:hypothetical protein